MKKRPVGLTILAIVNFIFAAQFLLGSLMVTLHLFTEQNEGTAFRMLTLPSFISTVLLIASGNGFLRGSYRGGFLAGLAYFFVSLGTVILALFSGFGETSLRIATLIYPTILLLLLLFKYRTYFLQDAQTEQPGHGAPCVLPLRYSTLGNKALWGSVALAIGAILLVLSDVGRTVLVRDAREVIVVLAPGIVVLLTAFLARAYYEPPIVAILFHGSFLLLNIYAQISEPYYTVLFSLVGLVLALLVLRVKRAYKNFQPALAAPTVYREFGSNCLVLVVAQRSTLPDICLATGAVGENHARNLVHKGPSGADGNPFMVGLMFGAIGALLHGLVKAGEQRSEGGIVYYHVAVDAEWFVPQVSYATANTVHLVGIREDIVVKILGAITPPALNPSFKETT